MLESVIVVTGIKTFRLNEDRGSNVTVEGSGVRIDHPTGNNDIGTMPIEDFNLIGEAVKIFVNWGSIETPKDFILFLKRKETNNTEPYDTALLFSEDIDRRQCFSPFTIYDTYEELIERGIIVRSEEANEFIFGRGTRLRNT